VKPTDDSAKFNAAPIGATVKAIWDGSKLIDATHGGEAAEQGVAVVLDATNFYAEMGGQVGDTGQMRSKTGAVFDVTTTRAAGGYVLHVGRMVEGHLSVGDHVTATLAGVRPRTEKNHTATHLANWALREVLGEGVQQKGSLVDPEKLRFDFSHGKALGEDELARIEELVTERIGQKLPVYGRGSPAGAGPEDQRPARRLRRKVPPDGARCIRRRSRRGPAQGSDEREVVSVFRRVLRRHAPEVDR
jgi:alanyl-tRNA synthetase